MRTLEEKIKFDYGLTTRKRHAVQFRHLGNTRAGVVYIPARGFPIMTIQEKRQGITMLGVYQIRGNVMRGLGYQTILAAIEEFNQLTAVASNIIIDT